MRVIHIPFTFAPDPVGGTEIYVELLANSLRGYGVESLIAAPAQRGGARSYEHAGFPVRRFAGATASKDLLQELYGDGDSVAAAAFADIIDEERPDAVHIHAFTRAISVLLVRKIKERGLPVFFTYHTPTVSCQRGTLMLYGEKPCDGALENRRCTSCSLNALGLPRWLATSLSYISPAVGQVLDRLELSGGMWTALRMAELMRVRHNAIQSLLSEVDGIVALREWVRAVLVRNGVPSSKIVVSEHGLPHAAETGAPHIDVAEKTLKVAFLGRANWEKGADTVVQAVRSLPELDVELHLYGVIQGTGDSKYWNELTNLAAHDRRIAFRPAISHDEVIPLLRRYHLLAVPSRWLETGPLVVLEAFAAGTPVVGSNLGGIAESINDHENGLLVDSNNVRAWGDALRKCANDRSYLAKLRNGIKAPRSMSDVAGDMTQLYRSYIA